MPKDERQGSALVPAAASAGVGLAGVGAGAHQWRAGKRAGKEYGRLATNLAERDFSEHQKLMAAHDTNQKLLSPSTVSREADEIRRVRAQGDDLRARISRGTKAREKAATKMSAGPSMAAEMLNSRLNRAQHQLHHAPDRPQFGTARHAALDDEVQGLYQKRGNLRRAFQHAGDNKKPKPQVHRSNLSTARILDDFQAARKKKAVAAFDAAHEARMGRVIDTEGMKAASEKARKPLAAAVEAADRKVMGHANRVVNAGAVALAGLGTAAGLGIAERRARKARQKANVEKYLNARVEKALQQGW